MYQDKIEIKNIEEIIEVGISNSMEIPTSFMIEIQEENQVIINMDDYFNLSVEIFERVPTVILLNDRIEELELLIIDDPTQLEFIIERFDQESITIGYIPFR